MSPSIICKELQHRWAEKCLDKPQDPRQSNVIYVKVGVFFNRGHPISGGTNESPKKWAFFSNRGVNKILARCCYDTKYTI
jgi:hypothetical protein